MRLAFTFAFLFALILSASPIQAVDKDKLRKAVKLPAMRLKLHYNMNAIADLEERKPRRSPEELQEILKGTPEDADVYLELSEAYDGSKNKEEGKKCRQKAIELLRRQLKVRPNDGLIHAKLGELLLTEHPEEAERLLRRAVELSPKELTCWRSLAAYHEHQLRHLILGKHHDNANLLQLVAFVPKRNLTAEEVRTAQSHIKEIAKCYDEAVRHRPEDPQAYVLRSTSTVGWTKILGGLIDDPNRNRLDAAFLFKAATDPEVIKDLRRVTQLDPKNYKALGAVARLEMMSGFSAARLKSTNDLWNHMPQPSREAILDCINKLKKLTQSKDRELAAGSIEMLVMVYHLKNEHRKAIPYCRRLVRLKPEEDKSWQLLTFTLAMRHDERLLPAVKQWVKHNDTAYTRCMLASAYDRAHDYVNVEKEIRAALRHDPKYFHANLALVALLLRRSDKSNTLPEAEKHLRQTFKLIGKDTPWERKAEFLANSAIYLGLSGAEAVAIKTIQYILRHDPDNKTAKRIRAALESR